MLYLTFFNQWNVNKINYTDLYHVALSYCILWKHISKNTNQTRKPYFLKSNPHERSKKKHQHRIRLFSIKQITYKYVQKQNRCNPKISRNTLVSEKI